MIPAPDSRGGILTLQAGRAIAALAVVAHHANIAVTAFNGSIPAILSSVLEQGYLGVDFFFVLSGFIIYWTAPGKSLGRYASSRARRIYIPYLPIGITMAVLYTFVPPNYGWSWIASLTLLPVSNPALIVAWTLQFELFFYVTFAVLYFSGHLRTGLLIWTAAIGIGWLLGIQRVIPLSLTNLEFICGILAAQAVRQGLRVPAWPAVPIIGLWLLMGAQRGTSVVVGIGLAFVIAAVAGGEVRGSIRTPRFLVFLGGASYAIYLVHNPAISVLARISTPLSWWVALPAVFLAASALGCAYHLFFELPALALSLRRRTAAA